MLCACLHVCLSFSVCGEKDASHTIKMMNKMNTKILVVVLITALHILLHVEIGAVEPSKNVILPKNIIKYNKIENREKTSPTSSILSPRSNIKNVREEEQEEDFEGGRLDVFGTSLNPFAHLSFFPLRHHRAAESAREVAPEITPTASEQVIVGQRIEKAPIERIEETLREVLRPEYDLSRLINIVKRNGGVESLVDRYAAFLREHDHVLPAGWKRGEFRNVYEEMVGIGSELGFIEDDVGMSLLADLAHDAGVQTESLKDLLKFYKKKQGTNRGNTVENKTRVDILRLTRKDRRTGDKDTSGGNPPRLASNQERRTVIPPLRNQRGVRPQRIMASQKVTAGV